MPQITISQIGENRPLYRVELRETLDGKPLLSRRFKEKHAAYGMALAVGDAIDVAPIMTLRVTDDGDEDC